MARGNLKSIGKLTQLSWETNSAVPTDGLLSCVETPVFPQILPAHKNGQTMPKRWNREEISKRTITPWFCGKQLHLTLDIARTNYLLTWFLLKLVNLNDKWDMHVRVPYLKRFSKLSLSFVAFSLPFHWRRQTTRPANNCLQIIICSCAILSKLRYFAQLRAIIVNYHLLHGHSYNYFGCLIKKKFLLFQCSRRRQLRPLRWSDQQKLLCIFWDFLGAPFQCLHCVHQLCWLLQQRDKAVRCTYNSPLQKRFAVLQGTYLLALLVRWSKRSVTKYHN